MEGNNDNTLLTNKGIEPDITSSISSNITDAINQLNQFINIEQSSMEASKTSLFQPPRWKI